MKWDIAPLDSCEMASSQAESYIACQGAINHLIYEDGGMEIAG
jgi:hypothetical protein